MVPQMYHSDDLTIRPTHPDDAQAFYEILTHPKVVRTLLELPSQEFDKTEQFIQEQTPGHHRLVAEKDGRVIGAANLSIPQNPRRVHSGDVDIIIHPVHWNAGVGSALMLAILDLADNWFNLLRVELEVLANNPAAIHLYEKLGFELEGTKRKAVFGNGRYQDIHIMARLRSRIPKVTPITPPQFPQRDDVISVFTRPQMKDDADELHAIWTNPAVSRNTNHYPSLEMPFYKERSEKTEAGLYRYMAIAEHADGTNRAVGNINIKQSQIARMIHSAWLGMAVHPDYWGIGIGSKLMETAVDLADNWLGLRRLALEVHPDNPMAIRLYERFGFELEGTKRVYSYGDGRWTDAHFMARLKAG